VTYLNSKKVIHSFDASEYAYAVIYPRTLSW